MKQKVYKELKGGDPVRVCGYSSGGYFYEGEIGVVSHIESSGIVKININNSLARFARSQLIKLKPRKKREKHVFECVWGKTTFGSVFPINNLQFDQFLGKRTKVTVEVLGDE